MARAFAPAQRRYCDSYGPLSSAYIVDNNIFEWDRYDAKVAGRAGVSLEQLDGDPLEASVTATDGVLRVTFATPPEGGERFRFEIDP